MRGTTQVRQSLTNHLCSRETGVIRTSSDLDYEQQKSYNLVVEAHDNGGRRGVTSVEVGALIEVVFKLCVIVIYNLPYPSVHC